jgi:hypothetical protein
LSAEPTIEELLEVQAYFGLPSPALVEKDFYVVKALAAIAVQGSDFADQPDSKVEYLVEMCRDDRAVLNGACTATRRSEGGKMAATVTLQQQLRV